MQRDILTLAIVLTTTACGSAARLPIAAGTGPAPALPPPQHSLLPTVNVAKPAPWRQQEPVPANGTRVAPFASGLDHPRWLYVLPNGDVLVAETNAPERPRDNRGVKGWFFKRFQKKAGGGVASANRLTLLRDADGDGIAETRTAFLRGLNSPFGMALVGNTLFIADTDAIVSVPYADGATTIDATPRTLVQLPAGAINHHWTKNVVASADGTKLFVAVGSNSNVAENGIAAEEGRAAIWEVDVRSGEHREFATGLRNPVGMAWEPATHALWVAVNERDELGGDLVPDYMTAVRDGAFYGWPYSYFGPHVDSRVKPQRPDLVESAVVPDYALGSHTASLGLAYSNGAALSRRFGAGMFVGQHGSWNRKPASGYRVVFVPFADGRPAGPAQTVLTGFLDEEHGRAHGRPVGVALDHRGGLLVADDVGNTVWRVSAPQ